MMDSPPLESRLVSGDVGVRSGGAGGGSVGRLLCGGEDGRTPRSVRSCLATALGGNGALLVFLGLCIDGVVGIEGDGEGGGGAGFFFLGEYESVEVTDLIEDIDRLLDLKRFLWKGLGSTISDAVEYFLGVGCGVFFS